MSMGDADRIIEAFQGLERSLERLHSVDRSHRQEIHINAGGVGVWIATTCCITMICCMLIGAIFISDGLATARSENALRKGEIERMQSYLNAIYVLAPSIKPKEQKDSNKKE